MRGCLILSAKTRVPTLCPFLPKSTPSNRIAQGARQQHNARGASSSTTIELPPQIRWTAGADDFLSTTRES